MEMLAGHPRTVFLGQAVVCPGTAMQKTFEKVPSERLIEFPVAEDMQMGVAVGMALKGDLPITCYPRWNFLLLAMSQLVLHLDKLPDYSSGRYCPRVIIRTGIATNSPLDPGPQHLGDFTDAVARMLRNVKVERLDLASDIVPAYMAATCRRGSTLLVEDLGRYNV